MIATLGRLDVLAASGQLDRLVRSGARFATQAMVLSAAQDDATAAVRRIGPALVFERLWAETGCRAVIDDLARERKHGFALERALFLTVLHRLMGGGSDLAADRWREDYRIAGVEALELHHLYRAMAWLGEKLPAREQDTRTPFAPRCTKDLVEERLFAHRRDLFSRLDLVFMDTTSLYFEGAPLRADHRGRRWEPGAGGQTLGRHGHSKDHRPDLCQMILAVLIDGDGRPVCSEMWPGNVADVTTLIPVIDRAAPALRDRPDLRGRRPRHDQRRDRGGARGAQAALSARHPRERTVGVGYFFVWTNSLPMRPCQGSGPGSRPAATSASRPR